jgi:hypothetical protein
VNDSLLEADKRVSLFRATEQLNCLINYYLFPMTELCCPLSSSPSVFALGTLATEKRRKKNPPHLAIKEIKRNERKSMIFRCCK